MANISKIKLEGVEYDIVDIQARGGAININGIDIYDDTLPVDITSRGDNLEDWVIYGNNEPGKNLVNLADVQSSTYAGITWTIDATNGIVTASGKMTSSYSIITLISPTNLSQYNGCYLSCDTQNVFSANINIRDAISYDILVRAMSNESVLIDNIPTTNCYIQLTIEGRIGDVVDNLIFKPMIRAANTTPDFDPYHLGVGQLNSAGTGYELPIVTKQKSKKNMLELLADTQVINGVTFTIDKLEGTVTVNGTNTTNSNIFFNLDFGETMYAEIVKPGTKYTAYAGAYSSNNCALYVGTTRTSSPYSQDAIVNTTGYITFTTRDDAIRLRDFIRVFPNATVDNMVFRPMIVEGEIEVPFESYWTPNTTTNIYLGTSPLTEGQSLSKSQATTKDIPTFNGECTIDTSYPNKPRMEIIPTDSAINIINKLRRIKVNNDTTKTEIYVLSPNNDEGVYADIRDNQTIVQIASGQSNPNDNTKLTINQNYISLEQGSGANVLKLSSDSSTDSFGKVRSGAALSGSRLDLWYENVYINGVKLDLSKILTLPDEE